MITTTITEDYVSFEVAKLLKEKGFNETCRAFWKNWNEQTMLCHCDNSHVFEYCHNSMLEKHYNDNEETNIAAPTLQMANKFLRKRYNIFIQVELYSKNGDFTYEIFKNNHRMDIKRKVFPTPEEANLDALLVCLNNLIE